MKFHVSIAGTQLTGRYACNAVVMFSGNFAVGILRDRTGSYVPVALMFAAIALLGATAAAVLPSLATR